MKLWLQKTISTAKERGVLPRNLDLTNVGEYYFANAYDDVGSDIISEKVCCGFSIQPDVALAKALSEFYEQKAFSEGASKGFDSCQTARSDGFAAYPVSGAANYRNLARKNALNEAIERFVWSHWWDNEAIGHHAINFEDLNCSNGVESIVKILTSALAVKRVIAVSPLTTSEVAPLILVGFLDNGGVVSGGACGDDLSSTIERAIAELYRHALAVYNIRKKKLVPQSFYEKRLFHFSSPEGEKQVIDRLVKKGSSLVNVGAIATDIEIPFSNSDIFYVHRVLFVDQPEFIGGKIERFCI